MPGTITHALSMTTPDDPLYENKPSNWNATHAVTFNLTGSEISGAFSNANGISFGLSADAITASYTVPSTGGLLSAVKISAGTVSYNGSALTLADSNGISFGLSASTLTASHNGLTSQSNQNVTANNGGFAFQTLSFSNANGISFGTSAGSAITGSHNALTTAALSDHSHGNPTLALTNISGTTASASNGFTLSLSGNAAGGGDAIRGIAANGSTASTNTVNFSNANGVSFGFGAAGNSTVLTASHNARASTDAIGLNTAKTNVTWTVNSSGLSIDAGGYAGTGTSATNASITLNSNGLAISVAAPGGGGNPISYFNWPEVIANSSAVQVSGSTKYVQPIEIPFDLSVSFMRMPLTLSCVGSMASTGTTANHTLGLTVSSTVQLAFYSLGTGANSLSLQSYYTTSTLWLQQATIGAGATGSNWSSGYTISYPNESGNNTSFTNSGGVSQTNRSLNSTQLTDFTALRFFHIPMATSFSGGMWWMAYNSSTSISTSGIAAISTVRILASNFAVSQPAQSINVMNAATASSYLFPIGMGDWSTNSIGTTTGSMQLAALSRRASNPILYFDMVRMA